MLILGGIFFVFVPTVLLFAITQHRRRRRGRPAVPGARGPAREGPGAAPGRHREGPGRATRWPCTSSRPWPSSCRSPSPPPSAPPPSSASASGAPASSSPTPPPASARSSSASSPPACCPGYLTTIVGFGIYSLIVNTIVGPDVGGWFFPTRQWWVLMLWVVPPFLALTLSLVLRLSAKVKTTAAAQQASGAGEPPADHGRLQPGQRQPLRRHRPRLVHRRRRLGARRHRPLARHQGRRDPTAASSASPTSSTATRYARGGVDRAATSSSVERKVRPATARWAYRTMPSASTTKAERR